VPSTVEPHLTPREPVAEGRGRVYVVMLCGAGDRPIERLGGVTPLEHAGCPHLDGLATRGALGSVTVLGGGIVPESDSGAMALLGYDPLIHYTGRGPLEGLGSGFWQQAGSSVAFRINFGSRDPLSGRLDRRTARDVDDDELQALADQLRGGVTLRDCPGVRFELVAFGRHRGILCFSSGAVELSGEVSNTDPGFRRVGAFGVPEPHDGGPPNECVPLNDSAAAAATARAVNAFVAESADILAASEVNQRRIAAGKRPANVVLFRDGGHELPALAQFRDQAGMTLALYGQVPAERGLCELIGARFVDSRPAPGESEERFLAALASALPEDDAQVVLVHLKGADEPGHDDRPFAKAEALERIDRCFIGPLLDALSPDDVLVVTGDHCTPCELRIHSADPVPTLVAGPGVVPDATRAFTEEDASRGGLPVSRAVDLLGYVSRLVGAR
jgi:2,3-bisphosphoglycerate-independent phosphoglycerate mutase